jgi:hypothetical protein
MRRNKIRVLALLLGAILLLPLTAATAYADGSTPNSWPPRCCV